MPKTRDVPIRLKIEISTRETEALDVPTAVPFEVANPWFSGEAAIPTYSREEMLATKLRELLQRDKGRDLYDLAHALDVFEALDVERTVEMLARYLELFGHTITRAQAQERMFTKLANPRLLLDMRPLLPPARVDTLTEASTKSAFHRVFTGLIDALPGAPWARTSDMKEQFGLPR